jgi:hypothetical protein
LGCISVLDYGEGRGMRGMEDVVRMVEGEGRLQHCGRSPRRLFSGYCGISNEYANGRYYGSKTFAGFLPDGKPVRVPGLTSTLATNNQLARLFRVHFIVTT